MIQKVDHIFAGINRDWTDYLWGLEGISMNLVSLGGIVVLLSVVLLNVDLLGLAQRIFYIIHFLNFIQKFPFGHKS